MKEALLREAEQIAHVLERGRSESGVADPEEGRVLPYGYTTEFYAWLCGLLARRLACRSWLDRAEAATASALTMLEPYLRRPTARLNGNDFHWEFKNLALVNVALLIGGGLRPDLRERLRTALLHWQDLNIDSANWTAMRALNYKLRGRYCGRASDHRRSAIELAFLLSRQTPEGFFPDTPRSRSQQYHAYVLALLGLYERATGSPYVRGRLIRGVRLAADLAAPNGDCNFFGRGQRQLFGYASTVLALSEGARCCAERAERTRFLRTRARIVEFIRAYKRDDGSFPLVLQQQAGNWGWYSYNRAGDYLAFAGVCLALASDVEDDEASDEHAIEAADRCYPSLGMAVVARRDWWAVFSARSDDLAEAAGLVHLWPHGPICLGGPPPERALGIDYRANYIGPLLNGQPLLRFCAGSLRVRPEEVTLTVQHREVTVRQTFRTAKDLVLEQHVQLKGGTEGTVGFSWIGDRAPPCSQPLERLDMVPTPIGPQWRWAVTRCRPDPGELSRFTLRAFLATGQMAQPTRQTVAVTVRGRRRRTSLRTYVFKILLLGLLTLHRKGIPFPWIS